MTNIFRDTEKFMTACEETLVGFNQAQFDSYWNEISKASGQLISAVDEQDRLHILQALVNLIANSVGAINSLGADAEGAWREVMGTYTAMIDRTAGKVLRDEDGNLVKPNGWVPPDMRKYIKREH